MSLFFNFEHTSHLVLLFLLLILNMQLPAGKEDCFKFIQAIFFQDYNYFQNIFETVLCISTVFLQYILNEN